MTLTTKNYVVYLITYSGDDLPPYYIGSTSQKYIDKGYLGSVRSKAYKELWNYRTKYNRELFTFSVIVRTNSRSEATAQEMLWQRKLSVVNSPLFVNMSYATVDGFFGMDVSGENNPRFGATVQESTRKKISEANKNHILVEHKISGKFLRVHEEDFNEEIHKTIRPRTAGTKEGADAVSAAMKHLAAEGMHWFQSQEFREKTSIRRTGTRLSEEQRAKMSTSRLEMFERPWLLPMYSDVNFENFCILLDFYLENYKYRSREFAKSLTSLAKELEFSVSRLKWFRKQMGYEESKKRFIEWRNRFKDESKNN